MDNSVKWALESTDEELEAYGLNSEFYRLARDAHQNGDHKEAARRVAMVNAERAKMLAPQMSLFDAMGVTPPEEAAADTSTMLRPALSVAEMTSTPVQPAQQANSKPPATNRQEQRRANLSKEQTQHLRRQRVNAETPVELELELEA